MSVSATRVKSPMLVVEIPVMWLNSCTTCTPQNPNDERQQRRSKRRLPFREGISNILHLLPVSDVEDEGGGGDDAHAQQHAIFCHRHKLLSG